MPLNSGVFTPLYSWVIDAINNINIRADKTDQLNNDIAAALSTALYRDGQAVATNDISFGNHKLTNVANAVLSTDATNAGQVQSDSLKLVTVAGTANAIIGSTTPVFYAYTVGSLYRLAASANNTGAVTLSLNGLAVTPVTKAGGGGLIANDLIAGAVYEFYYNGTSFQCLNPQTISGAAITEWLDYGSSPTFISATSFSVAGDQTITFTPFRRLKIPVLSGASIVYGSIVTSVFGAVTTVTVTLDSGALDATMGLVAYAFDDPSFTSIALPFRRVATGAVSRNTPNKLMDFVNVKDFGAKGDGVTDDTAAIQAAFTHLGTTSGGTAYLPAGTYIISATLNVTQRSVTVIGDGADTSILSGTHTTGAVLRFYGRFSGAKSLGITVSGARASATNSTGFGIQYEAIDIPDSTATRMQCCFCTEVNIELQPGTGLYFVGPATQGSVVKGCLINVNRGHGFAQDRGTLGGRVNLTSSGSGCMTLETCLIYNNQGNGVAAGAPTDTLSSPSVRVVIHNCEVTGNALGAGVYYSLSNVYFDGANHEAKACAFGGSTTVGGVLCTGRNMWIRNNRYLNCAFAVYVKFDAKLASQNINVEGMTVLNTTVPNMDPAVIVEAGTSNTRVLNWTPSYITSLITPNMPGTQIESIPQIVQKLADQSVTSSTTLVNDTELHYPLLASQKVFFTCTVEFTTGVPEDIKIAFTIPAGATLRWGPVGGIKVDAAGNIVQQAQTLTSGTAVSFGYNVGASRARIDIAGYVANGATAGDLQLQFAQDTAGASTTTIRLGSSHLVVTTALS